MRTLSVSDFLEALKKQDAYLLTQKITREQLILAVRGEETDDGPEKEGDTFWGPDPADMIDEDYREFINRVRSIASRREGGFDGMQGNRPEVLRLDKMDT